MYFRVMISLDASARLQINGSFYFRTYEYYRSGEKKKESCNSVIINNLDRLPTESGHREQKHRRALMTVEKNRMLI